MADIKLFNINDEVKQLKSSNVTLEKELQIIIEKNMRVFFGVTFLVSEYSTTDGGRMDSLGIDENNCPVIFEYKRSMNENVINQGLFYLNWLLDHKDSFKLLVLEKIDIKIANLIDWTMPRVVCIAGDFTKYDESAIKQMNRNIVLIRYRKFDDSLLMFEQLNQNIVKPLLDYSNDSKNPKKQEKTLNEKLESANKIVQNLYCDVKDYILNLGDDITENELKQCVAFKKIKNVVCIKIQVSELVLYLNLDTAKFKFEKGFSRNVSKIGHWGTGNTELKLKNYDDFEKAKPIIFNSYQEN